MLEDRSKRPRRYRLYVDESGDHAFRKLDQISHQYLALLGVWFLQDMDYVAFSDDLDALKRRIWGPRPDSPVVLHRSDMINRKGPFAVFLDNAKQSAFDQGLLEIVARARFTMICVVVDKAGLSANYSNPFHPYHFALAAMLERYAPWLDRGHAIGDVMAESRGKEEDLQLKEAYRRVYEAGTRFHDHEVFQRTLTSKDIKLKAKRDCIAGLELADILAHPVKIACLARKGLVAPPKNFGAQLVTATASKLNSRFRDGNIDGYGTVMLGCPR